MPRTVHLPGPHGTAWLQKETQATSGLGDGVLGWAGRARPGCSLGLCATLLVYSIYSIQT